jgi:hypothetical protein
MDHPVAVRTEFAFVLPRGFVGADGRAQRQGVIRLATARDEIAAQQDPRSRLSPASLTARLLERTVVELGDLPVVDGTVIEALFASDIIFLEDLYRRINRDGHTEAAVRCPSCSHEFAVDVAGDDLGES